MVGENADVEFGTITEDELIIAEETNQTSRSTQHQLEAKEDYEVG